MKLFHSVLFAVFALYVVANVKAVTISTVPVGNAGNANDSTGFGAVSHDYRIGTTEVTNAQYAEFLNAKAGSDPLALYRTSMGSGYGGITRGGSSPNFTYATITGRADMPVNYVSWYDTIRFANWLNNGQGNGDTETGAYTIRGGTSTPFQGNLIVRNSGATWFLANENEWYKAAYYDPGASSYSLYPSNSNTDPTAEGPSGGNNSANFASVLPDLTNVGAYTGSNSAYGTFDQGGNVFEWNESLISGSLRGLRGGSLDSDVSDLQSSVAYSNQAFGEFYDLGFRVATVPEPSSGVLVAISCGVLWCWRKRFK